MSPAPPDGRLAAVADSSTGGGCRSGRGGGLRVAAVADRPRTAQPRRRGTPVGRRRPRGGRGRRDGDGLAAARRCAWRIPTGCTTGSRSPDPRRRSRRSRPRRPGPGSFPGSSTRRASPRMCFSGWWRPRHRSSAASAWPAPASSPASCATPWHGGTTWRWPGSATAGPARSTCTRCCRCRRTSCGAGRTIRPRWPGCGQHWGTTDALRHVTAERAAGPDAARQADARAAVVTITFWSADWSPWRALAAIGEAVSGAALRPAAEL